MVFYAHEEGVVGGLEFRESPEWLDLLREAVGIFEHGALIAQIRAVPAQGVAREARHFVVEIVARGQHVEAAFARGLVEEVALDLAAGGAHGTAQGGLDLGDGQTLGGHFADDERKVVLSAEAFHHGAGGGRGLGDAEVYVQGRDVVALTAELEHEGQRILAAGQGHEHAVASGHEALFPDASVDLF